MHKLCTRPGVRLFYFLKSITSAATLNERSNEITQVFQMIKKKNLLSPRCRRTDQFSTNGLIENARILILMWHLHSLKTFRTLPVWPTGFRTWTSIKMSFVSFICCCRRPERTWTSQTENLQLHNEGAKHSDRRKVRRVLENTRTATEWDVAGQLLVTLWRLDLITVGKSIDLRKKILC